MRISLKNVAKGFITIFLTIYIIYNSGYLLMVAPNSIASQLFVLVGGISLILLIRFGAKLPLFSGGLLIICIINILISGIINGERANSFITTALMFVSAYVITQKVSWDFFCKKVIHVTRLICIVSLVMFYLIQINPGMDNLAFNKVHMGYTSYSNFGIFFSRIGYSIRNQGLFWEPGLYAGFLLIVLLIIIVYKPNDYLSIALLAFTVISTKSTTGLLMLFPVGSLLILQKAHKIGNAWKTLITLLIIYLSFFAVININTVLLWVDENTGISLTKIFQKSVNYTARLGSPVINLSIFLQSPIFGNGWNHATQMYLSNIDSLITVDAQTSTMTFYMAALGIAGILMNLVIVIGCLRLDNIDVFSKLILLTVVIIVLNSEPYSGLIFVLCLIFYLAKMLDTKRNAIAEKKTESSIE